MSVRLEVATEVRAPITRVWDELVDWPGQSRWIPFTTVRITTPHEAGLGVRASALSGFWLGRLPVGLLDRFVVTGWTPTAAGADGRPGRARGAASRAVLHRGRGVRPGRARDRDPVSCVELFDLPGGRLLDLPGRLLLPVLRGGFRLSLRRFAAVCES